MDKILIVGPASQILGVKIAKELGIDYINTESKTFPDGENYLRINVEDESIIADKEVIIDVLRLRNKISDSMSSVNPITELEIIISSRFFALTDSSLLVINETSAGRVSLNFSKVFLILAVNSIMSAISFLVTTNTMLGFPLVFVRTFGCSKVS